MNLNKSEEILRLRLQLAKEKEYLDVNDVMLYTGFSRSTIFRRVKDNLLVPYRSVKGGKLLFSKESIKSWIEGGLRNEY